MDLNPTKKHIIPAEQKALADELEKLGFGLKPIVTSAKEARTGKVVETVTGFEVLRGVLPTDTSALAAFEAWGAAKGVEAWKVRAAECAHGWGIGKDMTSSEFDAAIAAVVT